jgi:Ca2+-binding RTX toxin-like protein
MAAPTVNIVVSDTALAVGETPLVTFNFSEAVLDFTNADVSVQNGVLGAVSTSDGGISWTATLTPDAAVSDATNVITVDNTGVTDAVATPGVGTTDSNNYAIDTARPTASIVVADTALAVGQTSLVTVTFSEAVTGFTNADLTIANGSLGAVSSGDGGITWTATFTPTASITDTTNLITLDNTGVTDAAGNAGSGTTDSNNYAIDTVRPTAGIILADSALAVGETSLVTFTFSEAVSGFTNADLTIANGSLGAVSSADGGITWTATLTPTASVTDATNLITLDNTGVADAAGNAGTGTTDSNNYAVDTVRPTAGIVVADSALAAGETSLVTITFSEAVTGFSNADLTIANGSLSAVSSSDGGITWTSTFTPTASVTDTTNLITMANTGVVDAAGNAGSGTTDSNNYAIDTARPTAGIVVADNALAVGETSLVTITFSEAVTGFANADLVVANGALGAVSSADGGITWTATLTPTASITDSTNVITLANTGVADAAGNAGTGTTDSNNYAIATGTPEPEPEPPTPQPGTPTESADVITIPNSGGRTSAGGGADQVSGGLSNDFVQGNAGADTLSGGGGSDVVLGGRDNDLVQGNAGADTVYGDLGDDVAHGGMDNDLVQGNAGADAVFGDLGNDTVHGGQGDDLVSGGGGDDFVSGDLGNDTVSGGDGADTFQFFSGAGRDLVTDFDATEGDRVFVSSGAGYSLTQVGDDTVVALTGGGEIVLQGVQLSALEDGWILGA